MEARHHAKGSNVDGTAARCRIVVLTHFWTLQCSQARAFEGLSARHFGLQDTFLTNDKNERRNLHPYENRETLATGRDLRQEYGMPKVQKWGKLPHHRRDSKKTARRGKETMLTAERHAQRSEEVWAGLSVSHIIEEVGFLVSGMLVQSIYGRSSGRRIYGAVTSLFSRSY